MPPSGRPIAQKPNYIPNYKTNDLNKPSKGLISAPKPPSSAQSERQSFSDVEYEYEYDELGSKLNTLKTGANIVNIILSEAEEEKEKPKANLRPQPRSVWPV